MRQEPNTIRAGPRAVGAQCAGREQAVRLGPHALAVERDLVQRGGLLGQAAHAHDRVVVTLDHERALARAAGAASTSHAASVSTRTFASDVLAQCSGPSTRPAITAAAAARGQFPYSVVRSAAAARAMRGADQVAGLQLHAVVTARHAQIDSSIGVPPRSFRPTRPPRWRLAIFTQLA